MTLLPELYEPMTVGPMRVANRLRMAGMSAGTSVDETGQVTDEMIAYYLERARGEPGMIAIGARRWSRRPGPADRSASPSTATR